MLTVLCTFKQCYAHYNTLLYIVCDELFCTFECLNFSDNKVLKYSSFETTFISCVALVLVYEYRITHVVFISSVCCIMKSTHFCLHGINIHHTSS